MVPLLTVIELKASLWVTDVVRGLDTPDCHSFIEHWPAIQRDLEFENGFLSGLELSLCSREQFRAFNCVLALETVDINLVSILFEGLMIRGLVKEGFKHRTEVMTIKIKSNRLPNLFLWTGCMGFLRRFGKWWFKSRVGGQGEPEEYVQVDIDLLSTKTPLVAAILP